MQCPLHRSISNYFIPSTQHSKVVCRTPSSSMRILPCNTTTHRTSYASNHKELTNLLTLREIYAQGATRTADCAICGLVPYRLPARLISRRRYLAMKFGSLVSTMQKEKGDHFIIPDVRARPVCTQGNF